MGRGRTAARLVFAEMWRRRGRAAALGVGVLIAAVSFALLSALSTAQTVRVHHTVGEHARSAYDILVRPRGSDTALESSAGLVRANYLSGMFGGITLAQWHQVEQIPGVQVAAPIAMIGYVLPFVTVSFEVTGDLSAASRQVLRVVPAWTAQNGLSTFTDPAHFVYVTRHKVNDRGAEVAADLPHGAAQVCSPRAFQATLPIGNIALGPFNPYQRIYLSCQSTSGGRPVTVKVTWAFPFLLAAIDPVQEARLDGANHAITQGRFLTQSDTARLVHRDNLGFPTIPVVAATRPFVDDTLRVRVERLALGNAGQVAAAVHGPTPYATLSKAKGTPVAEATMSPQNAYQRLLAGTAGDSTAFMEFNSYWSSSPVSYTRAGAREVAPNVTHNNPAQVWADRFTGWTIAPLDNDDVAFRRLQEHVGNNAITDGNLNYVSADVVGQLDASRLSSFDPLTTVPLATFVPPTEPGGDARSRALLGGRPLSPDENIAGYLQTPPLLLTTIKAIGALTDPHHYTKTTPDKPISTVRVRVGDLHGSTRQQLTRIGQVATQIQQTTGLQVDVTAGSSPTTVQVHLPAGKYGRPPLVLAEPWVQKGAAVTILNATDRKSVTLAGLVLVVCGFFVANSAYAAVRMRRRQIATLRCLGWNSTEVFGLILAEVAVIGALAGLVGAGIAYALIQGLQLSVPAWHIGVVPPAAVAVAMLAGLGPAWRAGHARPLEALRPAARAPRRTGRPVRSVLHLAWNGVWRMPGRTVLGAIGLAVGVAALTILLGIVFAFHGAVTGDLLGNVVAVQVHGTDYFAAALITLLGAAAVIDVLVLNQAERSRETAILRATGWSVAQLARLSIVEGLVMAVAGSITGALAGLGVTIAITAQHLGPLVVAATAAAVGGIAVVGCGLILPAWLTTRATPAHTLADEG